MTRTNALRTYINFARLMVERDRERLGWTTMSKLQNIADRAPRIGDQVRIKMAGTLAIVIDISAEDGKPKEYLIESIGGQQQQHVQVGKE